MKPYDYPDPSAKLLLCGNPIELHHPDDPDEWPDYVNIFGLTIEDVPHIIRMLDDKTLFTDDLQDPEGWADVHAWRALGQLKAIDAIPYLIRLLDYEGENENDVSEWKMEEVPQVLACIGKPAVEPLACYLRDPQKGLWGLAAVGNAFVQIAKTHPECLLDCISAINMRLERFRENSPALNGFLIWNLAELKAHESLELIERAYQADVVEIDIGGDFEDIEIEMGVRQTRSTPRPQYHLCGPTCHENHEEDALWFPSFPVRAPKIGRNDPCPCESGKKYKKCCLKSQMSA